MFFVCCKYWIFFWNVLKHCLTILLLELVWSKFKLKRGNWSIFQCSSSSPYLQPHFFWSCIFFEPNKLNKWIKWKGKTDPFSQCNSSSSLYLQPHLFWTEFFNCAWLHLWSKCIKLPSVPLNFCAKDVIQSSN